MPIALIAIAIAGAFLLISKKVEGSSELGQTGLEEEPAPPNYMGLPDVLANNQKGLYKRDLDEAFEKAAHAEGVPFALLKAHGLRESNLKATTFTDEGGGRHSYGALQLLWWPGSGRWSQFGYDDDAIGDGSILFDPEVNAMLSARLMKQNWDRFGNLRDMVNAYNTGKAESEHEAPGNYVNEVLNYYSTLVGQPVG